MNLTTHYLGFTLPHPFIAGASPLCDQLDTVRALEDAGASAIVLRSLFEEQISSESMATHHSMSTHAESFGEALSYLPEPDEFHIGPHEYLEHLGKVKKAVGIPVIASLNGSTPGGWLEYASYIEQAGADALELNLYDVAADPDENAQAIEQHSVRMVHEIKRMTKLPLAVKLSPFYTSLSNFAQGLEDAGADGLVIFNRFFEPDIDLEELEVDLHLDLSDSSDLLLRLRWLAILSANASISLACTGGVHTALDALKAVMCGAHAVQLVSALLKNGPGYLKEIRTNVAHWLEEHEYESLAQAHGSMGLARCPDPHAYERGNYMRILLTWQPT